MTTIEALESAYQTCNLVRHQLANVIASGDFGESDVEYHKQADNFMKWYEGKKVKYKGDWRAKLEKSLSKMIEEVEKL